MHGSHTDAELGNHVRYDSKRQCRKRRNGNLPWSGSSYFRSDGEGGSTSARLSGYNADLQDVSLSSFKGKRIILNIFPSLDTPTCALSVRQFNTRASELENTVVLCLSMDLPFAQSRFCSVEGLNNVVPLSLFRSQDFLQGYGIQLADGPLRGLMARAVVVIDENGKVCYTQLVSNISNEPDYDAALRAANAL